ICVVLPWRQRRRDKLPECTRQLGLRRVDPDDSTCRHPDVELDGGLCFRLSVRQRPRDRGIYWLAGFDLARGAVVAIVVILIIIATSVSATGVIVSTDPFLVPVVALVVLLLFQGVLRRQPLGLSLGRRMLFLEFLAPYHRPMAGSVRHVVAPGARR